MQIVNRNGNSENWTGDIVHKETFTHIITVWAEKGVQTLSLRDRSKREIVRYTIQKGHPENYDFIHEWVKVNTKFLLARKI